MYRLPKTDKADVSRFRTTDPEEKSDPVWAAAKRQLLKHGAPAGVVVNESGEILYVHGHTSKYLELAGGQTMANVIRMAREELRAELASALHKAAGRRHPVHVAGIRMRTNGDSSVVNVTVQSVTPSARGASTHLFLVLFEEQSVAKRRKVAGPVQGRRVLPKDARIRDLEEEIRAKEGYLQAAVEEMETSNEELKSINEELQSVNEELQSTNEELETSKEEMQSLNEELATVNSEQQQNMTNLSRANNDMNNLLAGTGVVSVFVDHQLRIMRFTPSVIKVINLIQTDVGRPVGHIVTNLVGYDRLVEDVQSVLDSLIPREIEVETKDEAWFLLRILPYRTLDNVIEGAVITFIEITEISIGFGVCDRNDGTSARAGVTQVRVGPGDH